METFGVLCPQTAQPALVGRWMIIVALILLGAVLRLHRLDFEPLGLNHDEASYYLDPARILRTGELSIYYPDNNGREPLHTYLLALAFRLLGTRAWTIRLVTAFSGILSIPLLYVMRLALFRWEGAASRLIVLASAGVLAVSFWGVSASRSAFAPTISSQRASSPCGCSGSGGNQDEPAENE